MGWQCNNLKAGAEEARRLIIDRENVKKTKWNSRKVTETFLAPALVFGGLVFLFVYKFVTAPERIYSPLEVNLNINYYETLGVPAKATRGAIKQAYIKIALVNHPDKVPQTDPQRDQKIAMFDQSDAAYKVLYDSSKRQYFDKCSKYSAYKLPQQTQTGDPE